MNKNEDRSVTKALLVATKLFTGAVLFTRVLAPHKRLFLLWNALLALVCGFIYKYKMDFG